MYDSTAEPNEFVADSKQEAITKACKFFSVEKSELRVVELESGGQVAGLGHRAAIVAVPKNITARAPSARPERSERSEGRRDREPREGGREGGRERGRGRDRDRPDRGRERGRDRNRGDGDGASSSDTGSSSSASAAESPAEWVEGKGKAEGKLGPIGDFILGAVERMGLGEFTISESDEDDFIIYQLRGPAAKRLGGGDGRATDALQLLANQAEMRRSEDPSRIVVDAEGEEERRDEFLTRLAERAAKRAGDTGRAVALDPMNGRDRRILHMAVRELDGVVTMSIGSGRYRQVVIVPEGAPEYEEALAASKAAAEREEPRSGHAGGGLARNPS
jgi:predicted RNA-binding protein Jag